MWGVEEAKGGDNINEVLGSGDSAYPKAMRLSPRKLTSSRQDSEDGGSSFCISTSARVRSLGARRRSLRVVAGGEKSDGGGLAAGRRGR